MKTTEDKQRLAKRRIRGIDKGGIPGKAKEDNVGARRGVGCQLARLEAKSERRQAELTKEIARKARARRTGNFDDLTKGEMLCSIDCAWDRGYVKHIQQ